MNLKKYKLAWKDFWDWLEDMNNSIYNKINEDFMNLPLEMQLGVYIAYLENKGIDVYELISHKQSNIYKIYWLLMMAIEEAFKIREEQLK